MLGFVVHEVIIHASWDWLIGIEAAYGLLCIVHGLKEQILRVSDTIALIDSPLSRNHYYFLKKNVQATRKFQHFITFAFPLQ